MSKLGEVSDAVNEREDRVQTIDDRSARTADQLTQLNPTHTLPNPKKTALAGTAEISQTTGPIDDLYAGTAGRLWLERFV
uniref:Uncharacterized protein n=1 Tax=Strigamia maritima TaxID=126957 RepID=T1JJQ4_STRMM